MAQTKRKRTRKHRGTPAGTIERAGRTGRPQTREEAKKISRDRRTDRLNRPPTWRSAINRAAKAASRLTMDVRMFTVGPVAENTYIVRREGSDRALIVDPGDEADKLLGAVDALGIQLDAILLTHTHFDHVGAVAPVARATHAEVWVPKL